MSDKRPWVEGRPEEFGIVEARPKSNGGITLLFKWDQEAGVIVVKTKKGSAKFALPASVCDMAVPFFEEAKRLAVENRMPELPPMTKQ